MKLGVLPSFTGFSRFYRALPDFEWIFHLIHLKKKWKNEGHIVVIGSFKKKTESISKAKAESIAHPTIFQKLFTTLPSFFFHFFVVVVVEDTTKKTKFPTVSSFFFILSLSLSLSFFLLLLTIIIIAMMIIFRFYFLGMTRNSNSRQHHTDSTKNGPTKKKGEGWNEGKQKNKRTKERKNRMKKKPTKRNTRRHGRSCNETKKKKKGTTIMTHNININI